MKSWRHNSCRHHSCTHPLHLMLTTARSAAVYPHWHLNAASTDSPSPSSSSSSSFHLQQWGSPLLARSTQSSRARSSPRIWLYRVTAGQTGLVITKQGIGPDPISPLGPMLSSSSYWLHTILDNIGPLFFYFINDNFYFDLHTCRQQTYLTNS